MDKTKPYTFIQVTTAFPSLRFHSLKFLGSHKKNHYNMTWVLVSYTSRKSLI